MATPKLHKIALEANECLRYKFFGAIKSDYFQNKDNKEQYKQLNEPLMPRDSNWKPLTGLALKKELTENPQFYQPDLSNLIGEKLPNGISIEEVYFSINNKTYTEYFFDLNFKENKKLIWNISCYEYYNEMCAISMKELIKTDQLKIEKENGEYLQYDEVGNLSNKYQEWKDYCQFVNDAKYYIKTLHPRYLKFSRKEKLNFIEQLSQTPFTSNIAKLLDNYNLNEFKKAKIDKLLELNLPNITTRVTATDFTELYIKQNL